MGNSMRKPVSNLEKLDKLMSMINCHEEYYILLQKRKEVWIKNVVTYGIGLYFLLGSFIYAFWIPGTAGNERSYTACYVAYPVLLLIVKELIKWIFNIRLDSIASKLNCLRIERKEIINSVIRTEPFSRKCCLDKAPSVEAVPPEEEPQNPTPSLRRRPPPPPAPQQKSGLIRFLEYIAGEGCNNRFALICGKCNSHNGMAFREEYDYISFVCYNCHFLNPAPKQRPSPPKLGVRHLFADTYNDEELADEDKEQKALAQSTSPYRKAWDR